jgi:hypothetical protein
MILKKIEIISFAKIGNYYPQKPKDDTCQLLFDVSLLTETPLNEPDEFDPEKTIDEIIFKQNEEFFSSQRRALRTQINNFLEKNFDYLKIFFACQYGLLRSRVVADYFKNWISSNYPKELLSVSVTHMEIN